MPEESAVMAASTHPAVAAILDPLLSAIDWITRITGWFAALSLFAIAALIFSEVVSRSAFDYSLPFSWEYSAYAMGCAIFLGSGETLRTRGHIRVGALMELLPPGRARALDLLCSAVALVIAGYATWALAGLALGSLRNGSASWTGLATPAWVPQGLCAFGLLVLSLQMAARLLRLGCGLAPDDPPASDFLE